jgi:isoleucyl-tRNA synthetase
VPPAPAGEPPDLVCGGVDNAAEWLTALHLLSGLLYDQPASRQVLWLPPARLEEPSNPHDERPTPLALLREHGADALRWTIYLQPPKEALLVSPELVSQKGESFLRSLWALSEMLNKLVDLHLLRLPPVQGAAVGSDPAACLDDWLRSRLHSLVRDVTTALEAVDTCSAVLAVQEFVQDDLAGWYVPLRLNPRRDPPADSESYRQLFESLATLSRILAPLLPFLAEGLFQNLARGLDAQAGESVHLGDWPTFDTASIRSDLEADMTVIRRLAALGRAARQQGRLPLHQPLAEAAFALESPQSTRLVETYAALLAEDLNVRSIRLLVPAELDEALADERRRWAIASEGGEHAALSRRLTPELASEGLAGEFMLSVHELRQKAGLAPQERIRIVYTATARLAEALETHRERICADTQADDLQAFTQASQSRLSEAMKSLFTISEFSGEKVTFGIEKA